MRQLTLASLAAEQEVVPFSVLGEELRMEAAQLEHFILDCKWRGLKMEFDLDCECVGVCGVDDQLLGTMWML